MWNGWSSVLFATGAIGGGTTTTAAEPSGTPSASASSPNSGGGSSSPSTGGAYKFAENFCSAVDMGLFAGGGFKNASAPSNITQQLESGGEMSCLLSLKNSDYDSAAVTVTANVFATEHDAVSDYRTQMSAASHHPTTKVPGNWKQAMSAGKPETDAPNYGLYVQDGNLATSVTIYGYNLPWGNRIDEISKKVLEDVMAKLKR